MTFHMESPGIYCVGRTEAEVREMGERLRRRLELQADPDSVPTPIVAHPSTLGALLGILWGVPCGLLDHSRGW